MFLVDFILLFELVILVLDKSFVCFRKHAAVKLKNVCERNEK